MSEHPNTMPNQSVIKTNFTKLPKNRIKLSKAEQAIIDKMRDQILRDFNDSEQKNESEFNINRKPVHSGEFNCIIYSSINFKVKSVSVN